MKWLNPDEAEKLLHGYRAEPQAFVLYCDPGSPLGQLPAKPRVSTEDGDPFPTLEWVGLINDRPVVVQSQNGHGDQSKPSVMVLTPYTPPQSGRGEWSVLGELQELPRPIQPSRPHFIQSHAAAGGPAVCRPNDRGFFDVVYQATSLAEAEELLNFIKALDSWNQNCLITRTQKRGAWTIFDQQRNKRRVLGCYPDVDAALHVACHLSSDSPDDVLVVKDVSEKRMSQEYRIARGRVEGGTG